MILADSGATPTEAAILAAFSAADIAWTQKWISNPNCDCYEANPVLGRRPSLLKETAFGIVGNVFIDRLHNPTLRRIFISVEAANVSRNFTLRVRITP